MRVPHHYPKLPTEMQKVIIGLCNSVAGKPGYLDDAACPYSDELKTVLRRWEPGSNEALLEKINVGSEDEILSELEDMLREIKKVDADSNIKGADRVQLLKTKAGLIDKVIMAKSRVLNLKDMSQFQSVVVAVLDEVLTVDQRNQFMTRLKSLKGYDALTVGGASEDVE